MPQCHSTTRIAAGPFTRKAIGKMTRDGFLTAMRGHVRKFVTRWPRDPSGQAAAASRALRS